MALVSQSIKNLKGGISQQPEILRYPEQGSVQVNGWSSETEGLQKRPPMVFIKAIGDRGYLGSAPYIHLINRDEFEQYYAVFTGSDVKVFDLTGREYLVRGDRSYITVDRPVDNLRMVTVADYTFIVNRTRQVKASEHMTNGGTFRDDKDAIINVRGGQYGRKLEVGINGGWVSHQLPPGDNAKDDPPKVDAQAIAEALKVLLEAAHPTFTFNVGTGYIHVIAPADDNIREIQTKDGYADQLINPVTHYVQSFSKLPLNAPDGYMVKIVGDTSKTADQYYVKYDKSQKVWKETVGWNISIGLDYTTMPWTLVRAADGNFDLGYHDWKDRRAGDDDTNPQPSFVNSTITDVFFFRNRLGFISGENIVMSRTSKYFEFYPPSVANYTDDDPLDVAVSHNRVSVLKYAVSFAEELLLWSDEAQFVLSANGVLSAKTAQLDLTTQFDVSDRARPYGIGRNIYYASPRSSFTSIMRYYAVQDVSSVKNSEDMTAHVPNYIPNGVFSINGSATENFACVLTTGDRGKVFIYKFLYLDEEIRQQAWSHWDFGGDVQVLAANCIGSTMYLLMQNGYTCWLAEVDFKKNTTDFPFEPYRFHVDYKKSYHISESAYDIENNWTVINVKDIYGASFNQGTVAVCDADGRVQTYKPMGSSWNATPDIRITGDVSGTDIVIGWPYRFTYTFSRFLIKQGQPDGTTSTEDSGRLQLRRAWINYQDSGPVTILVDNGRHEYSYTVNSRLGSPGTVIGQKLLATGQYRFPVAGNALNQKVTVDSFTATPLSIIGCGWEGNYMRRANGI
ncbi:Phage tail fiber protein / T7-like tail tubular protein B [Klebsiella phage vB_KpnP_KpV289]|uniref:Phage tail fiber protein / T7-like tail tubular protein B n=2 Tax=Przondovirus TaxID=1985720 RepID=A0A0K2Z0K2_9CAUD|nr:tail protein [Klebsiella phage vB_KpnP_KpV289]CRN12725.1 Phage tail fiber protein / T7-like tail tubular protein B [Klebsiella phage vB_KpnP_KpV289]